MFFSENFKVLTPVWKRVTHFELIFVRDIRVQLQSFVCGCSIFQVPFVENYSQCVTTSVKKKKVHVYLLQFVFFPCKENFKNVSNSCGKS